MESPVAEIKQGFYFFIELFDAGKSNLLSINATP